MKLDITVIILTYNEEIHLRRCLDSVSGFAKQIYIIDSFSTDRTLEIAGEYDCVAVLQHEWENNHSKQFNWGVEHAMVDAEWILRLDADEYITEELKEELEEKLPFLPEDVTAISLPLRRVFLGRTIRRGTGGICLLRIFRKGKAESEIRWMDEHIRIKSGRIIPFDHEFADDNLNNLSWWTQKHIGYAIREAVQILDAELNLFDHGKDDAAEDMMLLEQAMIKRKKKERYAHMPLFWRAFIYFCYRYFLKGGFLEGREGFLWHFLQGWWYRTLVDAKVFEIKRACGTDRKKIKVYLTDMYGFKF